MNDFTKDELQKIIDLMVGGYGENVRYLTVAKKAQLMIDNYCEHRERVASSDENGHMVVQCGKCDLVLWHEKD